MTPPADRALTVERVVERPWETCRLASKPGTGVVHLHALRWRPNRLRTAWLVPDPERPSVGYRIPTDGPAGEAARVVSGVLAAGSPLEAVQVVRHARQSGG